MTQRQENDRSRRRLLLIWSLGFVVQLVFYGLSFSRLASIVVATDVVGGAPFATLVTDATGILFWTGTVMIPSLLPFARSWRIAFCVCTLIVVLGILWFNVHAWIV